MDKKQLHLSVIAERLGRSEIFSTLPEEDLIAISEFCDEETFRESDLVLNEEEPAEKMYVVDRGKVALEKKIEIGRHSTTRNATIGYVGPGEIFGFSTLVSPNKYSTSAICLEPTRLIEIDGKKLYDYLQSHPVTGLKVMDSLTTLISNRYRNATNTLTYFLSIVSHELRSPLAAIENYLRTMLGGFAGDLSDKQERMVKRSIIRVTDLRALIGDVVDLARMRPEQIQADFEWFDLSEIGTESIEDARLAAAEKDIKIESIPPTKFEPFVGARRRLRQVFTNLLNNSVKFSPPGTIVKIGARYEPEEVIFWVEDEGPGIPEDEIPHVFKDFFRGSNIEDTAGAGLGLSIAKKIVDAHSGDIQVENLVDDNGQINGTRFTVIIPRNLTTPKMRREEWMAQENK